MLRFYSRYYEALKGTGISAMETVELSAKRFRSVSLYVQLYLIFK